MYTWIDEAAKTKRGVEVSYKAEWDAFLYRVSGKMFGMRANYKDGRPILTLKLAPEQGDFLRNQFPYIIPGYYMNKTHYNSIFLDSEVTNEQITQFLNESYALVYASLTKKAKAELEQQ